MGFSTDDTRIHNSFSIATERGLSYSFTPCETETDVHPNTVDIRMENAAGQVMTIRGESLGGGKCLDDGAELIAQKDAVVGRVEADTVIGHAVLGLVVSTDLLGTVAVANLALALGTELGLLLLEFHLVQTGAASACRPRGSGSGNVAPATAPRCWWAGG